MAAYLDLNAFKARTLAPASYIDEVEAAEAGWTLAQLTYWSAWLDARLAKRYATPFDATNPPVIVQGWLARIVTHQVYLKRGVNPTDAQVGELRQDMVDAKAEVAEAANPDQPALFELPLRSDTTEGGISRGSPLSYSEVSPYTWSVEQRAAALDE